MSFAGYTGIVAAAVAASMGVCLPVLRASDGEAAARAALFGALLAGLNAVAAYGLVVWSRRRSNTAFMRAILGGMLVRMTVMLLAVVAAIRLLGLPQLPLTLSVLGHFVLFLAHELVVLQRASTRLQAAR